MVDAASESANMAGSEVSARYAVAFFDLARDQGELATIEADMEALGLMLAHSAELKALVRSPVFSAQEQSDAMLAVLTKSGLNMLVLNLVQVLIANSRLSALGAVIAAFKRLTAQARGEVAVEAISPRSLGEVQTRQLRAEIERSVGQAVTLNTKVDPNLLGGLIVKVGSRMVDDSLRTKLNRLKLKMKEA